ncbi:unnamed protein product [Dovyalis caffra]|uniref:MORF/ORRM1/DAG-like MORF domain-containing protein n=1 Tax=Dovyalis caffra TaxID=77055 RepID=A0AAV1SWQ9_9ROSI|nr:unnamed protein product [Dovyalis caffra]
MAQRLLRLHRTLKPLSSTLPRPFSTPTTIAAPASRTPPIISQWRGFTGTRVSMISMTGRPEKQYKLYKDGDEITEDTILFEGCDYNHWLVTVDFPKEGPKPTAEEMVATYERICAQGLNISIEEAKKRIYACSTTTYQGFQVLMTEQESEKFRDIPGVVFILPDSYIDPVNKEYGGDKYENGVITPRPPPVQIRGERRRERGRFPPRFDQQGGPIPNHQGPPPQYSQQGHMQGGPRNYGPQQSYPPQQNRGTPGHMQGGAGKDGPWQNYPPPQNHGPPGHMPGGASNYAPQQNYPPQQNYGPQGGASKYGPQQNYPPEQNHGPPGPWGSMPMNNRDYAPGGRNMYPGQQGNHYPPGQLGYNQGQQGNHYAHALDQTSFPQGDQRDHGSPGLRDYRGDNRNYSPTHGGNYGLGGNTAMDKLQPGEGQRFAQMEQRGMRGEQGNYAPVGQPRENYGEGGNTIMDKRHPCEGPRSAQMEQRDMQGEQGNYAPVGQPGWSDQESFIIKSLVIAILQLPIDLLGNSACLKVKCTAEIEDIEKTDCSLRWKREWTRKSLSSLNFQA